MVKHVPRDGLLENGRKESAVFLAHKVGSAPFRPRKSRVIVRRKKKPYDPAKEGVK